MNHPILASVALAILTSACASGSTLPVAVGSLTMTDGPAVAAPSGYVAMCNTSPELCEPAQAPVAVAAANASDAAIAPPVDAVADATWTALPTPVTASVSVLPLAPEMSRRPHKRANQAIKLMLEAINRRVNGRVLQQTDAVAFGRSELWQRSGIGRGSQGDCEDLAIEKREQLIAAGMPRELLFYATAYRQDLGLHTVLVARTARGDMVLDSRSPYVRLWRKLPYEWVSRQNPDEPMNWAMIVDPRRPAAVQLAKANSESPAPSTL